MPERRTIAIVGSAVVAVVAVVAVLLTSVARVPAFTPIADAPQEGTVAFFAEPDEDSRLSLRLVDLGTGSASTVPVSFESELLGWDDDGNLILTEWTPASERTVVVDPQDGGVVDEGRLSDAERDDIRGDVIWTEHRDGQVTFVRDVDTVVASFAAPASYDVTNASLMGDGRVVFSDELGRVAVMPAEIDAVPVLVADDALPWSSVVGR